MNHAEAQEKASELRRAQGTGVRRRVEARAIDPYDLEGAWEVVERGAPGEDRTRDARKRLA